MHRATCRTIEGFSARSESRGGHRIRCMVPRVVVVAVDCPPGGVAVSLPSADYALVMFSRGKDPAGDTWRR